MRVTQHPSSRRRFTEFRRKTWGNMFGGLLREARLEMGRSVEDAAGAAGMEVSEWEAVEAGQVPKDWAEVCRMTDALGVDRGWAAALVMFCQQAWTSNRSGA
jgi:transcriptional regulator with XRE-family HTH domain